MLTLFYSPRSRASRILTLIDELGVCDQIQIEIVSIARNDGSGRRDASNPHPEGKVPLLVHDGVEIWETAAIILYLTDLFPEAGLAPRVGDRLRGRYLSWLAWYGDVIEPVLAIEFAQITHPAVFATFRGKAEITARLENALSEAPYLLGDRWSAADLLVQSPFAWFPQAAPDSPVIADWIKRCGERPSIARTLAFDANAVKPA